jgi:hypothetical protein
LLDDVVMALLSDLNSEEALFKLCEGSLFNSSRTYLLLPRHHTEMLIGNSVSIDYSFVGQVRLVSDTFLEVISLGHFFLEKLKMGCSLHRLSSYLTNVMKLIENLFII